MAQADQAKPVGGGVLASLSVGSLGLVYVGWSKDMSPHPQYPANPIVDLPRLELRSYTHGILPAPAHIGSKYAYRYSLWYYRRQTPGQAHQDLLQADLATIVAPFLQNWRPSALSAVAQQRTEALIFGQPPVVHDEMRHDFDDPRLRVSVAEIPFVVTGWLLP